MTNGIINKIKQLFNKNNEKNREKLNRQIKVRFPSHMGDETKLLTIQQLQQDFDHYLIFDPKMHQQVDLRELANLEDVNEVVALPHITGGSV